MPAKAALTEEAYLRTSFPDLDREFRDGAVVERSLPDWFHSRTQIRLVRFFGDKEQSLNIQAAPELRVKLRTGRHAIPDVSIFWPAEPAGSVPDRLPLIAVEIISPDDRIADVMEKLREYTAAGIAHVWLLDPRNRRLYLYRGGLREVEAYSVPELNLTAAGTDLFFD
ncbi:MAG: Uma2 family endonuclease [Bryobacteraceae bacterium]